MCCRYWAEESPKLREIVEEMNRSPLVWKWQQTAAVKTYGEMRPTDVAPVIAPNRSGNRSVRFFTDREAAGVMIANRFVILPKCYYSQETTNVSFSRI